MSLFFPSPRSSRPKEDSPACFPLINCRRCSATSSILLLMSGKSPNTSWKSLALNTKVSHVDVATTLATRGALVNKQISRNGSITRIISRNGSTTRIIDGEIAMDQVRKK